MCTVYRSIRLVSIEIPIEKAKKKREILVETTCTFLSVSRKKCQVQSGTVFVLSYLFIRDFLFSIFLLPSLLLSIGGENLIFLF